MIPKPASVRAVVLIMMGGLEKVEDVAIFGVVFLIYSLGIPPKPFASKSL